jgi:dihydrofolate synthase/folylpolyglutamate synthase
MNYEQSVRALLALGRELGAPQQARVQKFGLGNISTLAEALGNPHRAIPCVHIAGTNGKGSSAAMLESILRAAGVHTALYTSPHLERINERIRIDGQDISDTAFAVAWTSIHRAIEDLLASRRLSAHPTFFECITAIAFLAIAESGAEFAIYEVGLGGRLDATNIVEPEVAIITPIDFDHESFLGHSIEEIAAEKAAIIKSGAKVVSASERPEARAVIARRAAEQRACLVETSEAWRLESVRSSNGFCQAIARSTQSDAVLNIEPSLPGRFQIGNALTAATAAGLLRESGIAIEREHIEEGIRAARWPGRLECIAERPRIYLDGAHNPSGARELRRFWDEEFPDRRVFLVFGAMRDKAVDEISGLLFPRAAAVILTEPRQPRAISASLLAEMTAGLSKRTLVAADPAEALEKAIAMAQPEDIIFVTGSLFLVGDIRARWSGLTPAKASNKAL